MLNKHSTLAFKLKSLRQSLIFVENRICEVEGGIVTNFTTDEAIANLEGEMDSLIKLIELTRAEIDWYRKGVVN